MLQLSIKKYPAMERANKIKSLLKKWKEKVAASVRREAVFRGRVFQFFSSFRTVLAMVVVIVESVCRLVVRVVDNSTF
jgi:hypothetical protein